MPWNFNSTTPIYIQIIEHIKMSVAVGDYKAGDKLLSVRELAAEAEVNPNTMQKALSELDGFVDNRYGFLHCVCSSLVTAASISSKSPSHTRRISLICSAVALS